MIMIITKNLPKLIINVISTKLFYFQINIYNFLKYDTLAILFLKRCI